MVCDHDIDQNFQVFWAFRNHIVTTIVAAFSRNVQDCDETATVI